MAKESSLEKLLFKYLKIEHEEGDVSIVLVFAYDKYIHYSADTSGDKNKSKSIILYLFDFGKTVHSQIPAVDTMVITNIDEFLDSIEEINPNEMDETIRMTHPVILNELMNLNARAKMLSQVIAAMRISYSDISEPNGLLESKSKKEMVDLVLNILGGNVTISDDESNALCNILSDILLKSTVTVNLENQDDLKQLRSEVEYKVIDTLHNVKASDIIVNMQPILDEIKRRQQEKII